MASSPTPSPDPQHKDYPYAHWLSQEQWKQALHRRAAHKALDIAEEPDDVNVNHQRWSGLGWKELAVIIGRAAGRRVSCRAQRASQSAAAGRFLAGRQRVRSAVLRRPGQSDRGAAHFPKERAVNRPPAGLCLPCRFRRARDGDTIGVSLAGSERIWWIRLIDCWAPELSEAGRRAGQAAGRAVLPRGRAALRVDPRSGGRGQPAGQPDV